MSSFGSHIFKKNVDKLEKIQRIVVKMNRGLESKQYEECF